MKKRIMALILAGILVMALCGCRSREPEVSDNNRNAGNTEIEAAGEE